MRWGEDDSIGLHQRHLLILDMLMEVACPRLGHGLWGRCLISMLDLTLIGHVGGDVAILRLQIDLLSLRWQLLLLIVLLRGYHCLRSIARLLYEHWAWLYHRLLLCTIASLGKLARILRRHLLVRVGVRHRLLLMRGIHYIKL